MLYSIRVRDVDTDKIRKTVVNGQGELLSVLREALKGKKAGFAVTLTIEIVNRVELP